MKEEYLEKIGNVLKKAREEKGYSVEYVASILKINPDYIRGLEEFKKEHFPAAVFFKGFLKNYAIFLNLNVAEILKDYSLVSGESRVEWQNSGIDTRRDDRNLKRFLKPGYLVIWAILLLIVFSWLRVLHVNYKKKSELEKRIASNFNTMTTAKELALHEEKKKLFSLAQQNDVIKIKTNDSCWIEVKHGNVKIFQGLLLAGEEREISYKKGTVIKVGNAEAIELNYKGEIKKGFGKKGEVKEIVID